MGGIAALGKALMLYQRIGFGVIQAKDQALTARALRGVAQVPGPKVRGVKDPDSARFAHKGGVIASNRRHWPRFSFMVEDEFIRHIREMRGLYEERRDLLLAHARQFLPDDAQLDPRQSGLHVIGRLPEGADEFELVRLANLHGVTAYPLSGLSIEPTARRGIALGFVAFREDEIESGVQRLSAAWQKRRK